MPILTGMSRFLPPVAILALLTTGCALPPPDQPAHPNRMGRFLGLVANCGCSDISAGRMLADYPRAVAERYSPAEIQAMKGWVELGATERYDNQIEICAQACSQTCMVNAVAAPLGGRVNPGVPACLVSERDLHLTQGRFDGNERF